MKKKIFFLCSPSLGSLDSWLSVLATLKKISFCELFIIFPRARTIDELPSNSPLLKIARKIFDGAIYLDYFDNWVVSSNFPSNTKNRSIFFKKVLNKLKCVIKIFFKKKHKRRLSSILSKNKYPVALCYDVYEDSKDYNYDVKDFFKYEYKFSIDHGSGIWGTIEKYDGNLKKCAHAQWIGRPPSVIYLYSYKQIDYFKSIMPKETKLSVVGFPRHDDWWINEIVKQSPEKCSPVFNGPYILVVSRPATSDYFSLTKKKQAVVDILKTAKKHNLNIIVKPHPKEIHNNGTKDQVYEKIFGLQDYDRFWLYSNDHVFSLAQHALFSVCFFSSVPVDLAKLNVPIIYLSSLIGLPSYDNKNAKRDSKGRPVKGYRYFGLGCGADNFSDMENCVNLILKNRAEFVEKQNHVYDSLFPNNHNTSFRIASEILNYLDGVKK